VTNDEEKRLQDLRRRAAERTYDRWAEIEDKSIEAAITSGANALRTAILVNGAAAISVLAFIGGLVGNGKLTVAQSSVIAGSLMWFVWGVASAGTAMGLTYLNTYAMGGLIASYLKRWEHPYLFPSQRTTRLGFRRSYHVGAGHNLRSHLFGSVSSRHV
jgi:hypothetical protein